VHEIKERADLGGQDLRAQIYGQNAVVFSAAPFAPVAPPKPVGPHLLPCLHRPLHHLPPYVLHCTSLTHLYPTLLDTSTCALSIPRGISHLVSPHHLILLARVSSTNPPFGSPRSSSTKQQKPDCHVLQMHS
jgi:hypothetical protein